MAGFLRKIMPVVPSTSKEVAGEDVGDDNSSYEYSFALKYSGPPVGFDIPRAVPIDVNQIPTAATVESASLLNDVPVIQPIVKSSASNKKKAFETAIGSGTSVCSLANGVPNKHGVPFDSLTRVDRSSVLECAVECVDKFPGDGTRSPESLGSCGSHDRSHESLESLKAREFPGDDKEDRCADSHGYMNPAECESAESDIRSRPVSSEIFTGGEDDAIEEASEDFRKPSVVTFNSELEDVFGEESDLSEVVSGDPEGPRAVRPGKKGTCYKCLKGNRFTEKEVCIVCGAKYCRNCVLRVMGSMPEGRKCVPCIGHRIYEPNRKTLGKSSRLLKQLLPELQVKQIMNHERLCEVNQLPPELVHVNGEPLSQEMRVKLQNCQYPPKKLSPGYYWYDQLAGFWGKVGHKPCQIISPQLGIRGHIQRDASKGNTNVLINNREITKTEFLMLQLAGVKCEGATHFWVGPDGSYQEEGMNYVKGKIWEKTWAKGICTILSLPIPPDFSIPSGEEANAAIPDNLEPKILNKLLLVGYNHSGTSTIFKQAKILYNVPFSEDERQKIKVMIQNNLYGYLGILLEGREQFEEESLAEKRRRAIDQCSPSNTSGQSNDETTYSISPKLKPFSDWILKVTMSGNLEKMSPAATCEYAPLVEDLWKDAAIQATYERKRELPLLPKVATYFLEHAAEIARANYEPSDIDILYAEGITSYNGISCMEFSFPESVQQSSNHHLYQHDPFLRYQLIRVHQRILGGNYKWPEMFEDAEMVLFCVSLTDYAEFSKDSDGVLTNKMMTSKWLFERIVTHPTFEDKKFLLLLNKFDLLEEKIKEVPLSQCKWFDDFNPVIGHNHPSSHTNTSLAQRAFQYIAVKFKKLFNSLTDKKLFVSRVTGLEHDRVDETLRYAREILKWEEEESNIATNELSSTTSIEAGSSS